MAAVLAAHGLRVTITDVSPDALRKVPDRVREAVAVMERAGTVSRDRMQDVVDRVACTADLARAVEGANLVIEAIPEHLELKRQLFQQLESLVSPDCILASNTSGLPITSIAEVTQRPERIIGMHWSNPPHIIPLIEVIRGEKTSEQAVTEVVGLVRHMGMIPVVVSRDVPGFVENRLLYALLREALYLWEQGVATAQDIDAVARWGIGFKLAVIGPLALLDMAGLDIYASVASYLNGQLCDSKTVTPLIQAKVTQGKLGIKTGEGIYPYSAQESDALARRRGQLLVAVRKALMGGNEQ
jgi:3-hydroxybutyryl-CoA dehydrogenase/5-formyl-3-hydroxy-2-methylpyridine 4-carboxylate dehydrogenase